MSKIFDKEGNVLKAGAIIIQDDKVLLIFRAKWNDWTFPKGHLEEGESIEECMAREVEEETGLKVMIIKPLPDIIYEYPEKDNTVRVKMFLVEPKGGELRPEKSGDKLAWFSWDEVVEKLSYDSNNEYFLEIRSELE